MATKIADEKVEAREAIDRTKTRAERQRARHGDDDDDPELSLYIRIAESAIYPWKPTLKAVLKEIAYLRVSREKNRPFGRDPKIPYVGWCWASERTLAERCGCSERTIRRAVSQLKEDGVILIRIRRDSHGHLHNEYFIIEKIIKKYELEAEQPEYKRPKCRWQVRKTPHAGRFSKTHQPKRPVSERSAGAQQAQTANASDKRDQSRAFLGELEDFVRTYNPRILPLLEAIALTGTQDEAAGRLEVTGTDFGRFYRELRELGHSFTSRKARPKLRTRAIARYGARGPEALIPDAPSQPPKSSIALGSICWNRLELYNEVWSQPLVKLSRKYGISDVRLGKVCRRLRIPHPGRGYWAKRAVGQTIEQVPLPEFKDAPVVRRLKTRARRRNRQTLQSFALTPNSTHLPTDLPTPFRSCDSLQRLAAPAENLSR